MNLARRGVLKLLGVAPAAVATLPALGVQAAGYGVAGIGAGTAMMGGLSTSGNSIGPSSGTKFFSFAKWLYDMGEKEIREESKYVVMVDPDIANMRLPLQTKVLWQTERNYQRKLEQRKSWFERQMDRDGHVTIW